MMKFTNNLMELLLCAYTGESKVSGNKVLIGRDVFPAYNR